MKNWTVKRLVLMGFGSAAAIFALLLAITWQSAMRSQAITGEIEHGNAVLILLGKLNAAMTEAAVAQRTAGMNPSPEAEQRVAHAMDDLEKSLAEATWLVQDNPRQAVLIGQARDILVKRKAVFEFYRTLWRNEGIAGVFKHLGKGEQLDAQYRYVLQQTRLEEMRTLKRLQSEAVARAHAVEVACALMLAFLAVFLPSIYYLIHRSLHRDETHVALEKSEALLRQILELLPVGVFVADKAGKPMLINPAVRKIWGTSEDELAKGYDFPAWRLDSGKKVAYEDYGMVRALRDGSTTFNDEFEIQRTDGDRRIVRSSAMPLRDNKQNVIGAITVNMDVTDLKQAERELQAARDALEARVAMRTRELVGANKQLKEQIEERKRAEQALRHTESILTRAQRIARIGSWERRLDSSEVLWSDEVFRIFGFRPGEIHPTLDFLFDLIHPEDKGRVADAVHLAISSEHSSYKVAYRIIRPDDVIRYVQSHADIVFSEDDHTPVALIGTVMDITEQAQTEESLRQLAAHQELVKEEERKRIAREIHDEMGQNLMVLRIDVAMLHARTADRHSRLHARVEGMLQNIDNTIKSVRAIINNLRPVVLDLGLYAALQWQINEFQRRAGICCELSAKQDDLDCGLSEAQVTALFRVLQESLTNVSRHAKAHNVYINLQREEDTLTMRIADDGIGLYPGDRRKPKSFGLLGMRERISALGGQLVLDSVVGEGTVLTLSIPLPAALETAQAVQNQIQA